MEATCLLRPCMSPSVCGTSWGPLPATSTSQARPWPLRQRRWQSRTVPSPCPRSCPHRWPHQTHFCPSLSCTWLQDPVPPPWAGGMTETHPLGSILQWFKKKKKKKTKTQQNKASGRFSSSVVPWGGRQEGASPGMTPLLGWWPGEPGRWHLAPSLPPLHPPRFLTTFERFL